MFWMSPDNDPYLTRSLFCNVDFGTTDTAKYAAAYYPRIYTRLDYNYQLPDTATAADVDNDASVTIKGIGDDTLSGTLADLKTKNNAYYFMAKNAINAIELLLPASSAVVGKYAESG